MPVVVYFPNDFDWGYTNSNVIMSKKFYNIGHSACTIKYNTTATETGEKLSTDLESSDFCVRNDNSKKLLSFMPAVAVTGLKPLTQGWRVEFYTIEMPQQQMPKGLNLLKFSSFEVSNKMSRVTTRQVRIWKNVKQAWQSTWRPNVRKFWKINVKSF